MALFGITLDEWMEAFSTGGMSLIMTKKHNHHNHCEHKEVAYCGHCQVVYCKECKREWSDRKLTYYPYTYPWYVTATDPHIYTTITGGSSDTTFADATSDIACSHG